MLPKHQAVTHTGKGFFRSGSGSGNGNPGKMPKLKHLGGNACRTDAIAIELHDDTGFGDARILFAGAIHNEHVEISHRGELTICRRP
jgi:hypothetical protein